MPKNDRIDFGKRLREAFSKALSVEPEEANVYFQPPEKTKMAYPCIIYKRYKHMSRHANNVPYTNFSRYQVTSVSTDPDSPLIDELLKLPKSSYDRQYVGDGLYHDVFEIYY